MIRVPENPPRQRKGLPNDDWGRELWLEMADLRSQLPVSSQVEFARYVLLAASENEELEETEAAEAVAAVFAALEALTAAGW